MGEAAGSIKAELEALRPFVDKAASGSRPLYSEEELREAEARLGTSLPVPVRELYRQASDLLIEALALTPLELLHWEGEFLGFYEVPDDGLALGIRRGGDPNRLYCWELTDPEEESYDFWDEFAELCEDGDTGGRRELARRCHAYWTGINARYPDLPAGPRPLGESGIPYTSMVDAHGLFLVIHALNEAFQDLQREHPGETFLLLGEDFASEEAIEWTNGERRIPESYFVRLHRRITQGFAPLSSRSRLLALETGGLQMAYLHRDPDALLLAFDWDFVLTLLVLDPPETAFLEELRAFTGSDFKRCNL